ncbi:SURF1 family protein [Streptacidiphilus cavernicola]|uniref:SURF1-like protein n=1 Tax=Streptacidiphilus cavernicola TaxID=3342716 RepID=A0ABV6VWE8_9ACTN
MYRFLLTPRWLGIHLFAVLAVPACIWLGVWQLSRFELHSHASSHAATEVAALNRAVPLAPLLKGPDAQTVTAADVGREITVSGRYDTAHQLLVPKRTVDGRSGYYVLTPLRPADGGLPIPVIRGWTARASAVPAAPVGTVELRGRLQTSEDASSPEVIGSGGLPAGQVGMISPSTLVNVLPYTVYDGWIALDKGGETSSDAVAPAGTAAPAVTAAPAAPAGSSAAATSTDGLTAVPTYQPTGGAGLTLRAFQNLGYTLQWFVFAGFVIFMWARFVRREVEVARDRDLGLTAT